VAHLLDENADKYEVVIYGKKQEKLLSKMPFADSNDARILASALSYSKDIVFVTNDICLKCFAKMYLPNVESIDEEIDTYKGYKEVEMTEEEMDNFYSHFNDNLYNLYNNEYLIIRNTDGDIIDRLCWTEDGYRQLNYSGFYSTYFGNVKVKRNDPYQAMLADSFLNNQITMVKGPAGSGKTYLSLAFLLHQLEKNKIDTIIVFCNTIATKDSAKLGFYPGTRDEKLLDSQIGNLLASKLGGKDKVEQLIEEKKLILLPMSDIRGYDTSGLRAGVYISEAQNMSINLMKLALQRIGEDSICIIDGDCAAQVDDDQFAGANNGMRRASKVFRGTSVYGEITLQNIYRSKIGQIAENM
jgi:predicted ribonuclease YlaK